eukprot:GEMP01081655.1.p1 GENE.GEMP01081655.1~~GEMP01081655.1.p1  ORF type:complete len:160 (+),score=9.77 GEMP01081655.1:91-570(+)
MAPSDLKPADLDWRVNWIPDAVQHALPRWSFSGPGTKQGQWRRRSIQPKFQQGHEPKQPVGRDTFIDHNIRLDSWKPDAHAKLANSQIHKKGLHTQRSAQFILRSWSRSLHNDDDIWNAIRSFARVLPREVRNTMEREERGIKEMRLFVLFFFFPNILE